MSLMFRARFFALIAALVVTPAWSATEPAGVVLEYARALYARDFERAYQLVSPRDKAVKPRPVYLQENRALEGEALEFSRLLASMVVVSRIRTNRAGDRATVTFRALLPDANADRVREMTEGFDAAALKKLSASEREARMRELKRLSGMRRLPTIESANEEWHLVRVDGRWWLDLDWDGAVRVRFGAATFAGLGWEFAPLQEEVRARPGETLQVVYRLRNATAGTVTAKARHVVTPGANAKHLDIVTCFCFLEQTLGPGQVVDLPVVFRVSYDAPENIGPIEVRYELYPAEAFPKDAAS